MSAPTAVTGYSRGALSPYYASYTPPKADVTTRVEEAPYTNLNK